MVEKTSALKRDHAASGDGAKDGVVFVRRLAPGCWALTSDHRVFYIHRRQGRRIHHHARTMAVSDPWSPDKGIA